MIEFTLQELSLLWMIINFEGLVILGIIYLIYKSIQFITNKIKTKKKENK